MTKDTPTTDQNLNQHSHNADSTLLAGSPKGDPGPAVRYERGEIDIYTLVSLVPESSIPSSLLAVYLTAKHVIDAPQFRTIADDRKREQRSREFLNQLGLWRLQRGEGYVRAYEQFQRTGKDIEAGQRVFEGDWFRLLQEQRAREIAVLEERQKAGDLNPTDTDRLHNLRRAKEGDKQVSEDWKSLSDDYQKLKVRENTGALDEQELREKEAQLKQRMFDQLDKASPELREKLLTEIGANDPSFRREYEDRIRAQGNEPTPAMSDLEDTIADVRDTGTSADLLIEDLVIVDRPASASKAEGIKGGIKTGVDMNGAFAVAVMEDSPGPDTPPKGGPELPHTGKRLTSDLA